MNRLFFQAVMGLAMVMDTAPNGDGAGGGGGKNGEGDKGKGAGSGGDSGGGNADLAKLVASLAESNKTILEQLAKIQGGTKPAGDGKEPKGNEPDDLAAKAARERAEKEKSTVGQKDIEKALAFTLTSSQWVKDHGSLMPKGVEDIFALAEKENFATAIEKASAIKVGLILSYFSQQANYDLLTQSQKNSLDEFKNLTKDLKQDRAQAVWETVFEPTVENAKRVLRASQLSNGQRSPGTQEAQHTIKMYEHSKKAYLKK